MHETTPDVQDLVERARRGDEAARGALLNCYRDKLNRMVSIRLDRRLAARVDASDVVQETLAVAARNLDDYLRSPPLPFLGWLRQLAAEQVVDAHRHHVVARRRSIHRETRAPEIRNDSIEILVRRIVANDTSPSDRFLRRERIESVTRALDALEPVDRDVLAMRYLEQLGAMEIAEVLGIREGAVKSRIFRALDRLRRQMEVDA